MARFRGTVKGQRGEASRLGSGKSGLKVSANGWNVGVFVDTCGSEGDCFHVYATGGSNGGMTPFELGAVFVDDGKVRFVTTGAEYRTVRS